MKAALLLALVGSLAIYGWAIRKLFLRTERVAPAMQLIQVLGLGSGIATAVVIALADDASMLRGVLALVLYGLALCVFAAARRAIAQCRLTLAFSKDVPQQLVQHGIYSVVRHPFYLAYSLTWFAGLVAVPHVVTAAASISMLLLYILAARYEEQKFARSALAEHYATYVRRTGMLWPSLAPWLHRA